MEKKALRELVEGKTYITDLTSSLASRPDVVNWLQTQAVAGDILLAHAENGVVWGISTANGHWVTSSGVVASSPALCTDLLWDARLFNAMREVFVWRDGDGVWHAREIKEGVAGTPDYIEWYDETQLLWGDRSQQVMKDAINFTVLSEGAQGLRHALPLEALNITARPGGKTRIALQVRHYLAQDDVARVVASRLFGLAVQEN